MLSRGPWPPLTNYQFVTDVYYALQYFVCTLSFRQNYHSQDDLDTDVCIMYYSVQSAVL